MTKPESYFEDPHSGFNLKVGLFRPSGSHLTYEVDDDYQLAKLILVSGDTRKTLCVMDWETAYQFASALSVATVRGLPDVREVEADAIEALEMQE